MEPRLSLVTLGVKNIALSRKFYEEGFGWQASSASTGDVVFFKTAGAAIGLYLRVLLADDVQVPEEGSGFRGITLAHNVAAKEDVAPVLKKAEAAGAKIIKPAQDVFWGGHSGYFADPDGHLWEVAWNPFFPMDARGELQLP